LGVSSPTPGGVALVRVEACDPTPSTGFERLKAGFLVAGACGLPAWADEPERRLAVPECLGVAGLRAFAEAGKRAGEACADMGPGRFAAAVPCLA
jgi:hypothetical protein